MLFKRKTEFQRIGLALLLLYLLQVTGGIVIHFFKTPSLLNGRRPPQNYFHAVTGLTILALAFYQVHYGIQTEWYEGTGDGTIVPMSALHAWIALMVVCYFISLCDFCILIISSFSGFCMLQDWPYCRVNLLKRLLVERGTLRKHD